MPLINLIHEQRLAKQRSERKNKLAMFGFVGSLLVGFGMYSVILLQTEATKGHAASLKAQVDKMEPVRQAIEATELQYNALSPRLTTLQDAALNTQRWGRVLEHLSFHVPSGLWLTQLRCNQVSETEPIVVDVQGMAPTQEIVSEFILRLQSSEDLEGVSLKYTQGDQVEEQPVIRFEVTGNVAGSAKAEPVAKEEEGAKS